MSKARVHATKPATPLPASHPAATRPVAAQMQPGERQTAPPFFIPGSRAVQPKPTGSARGDEPEEVDLDAEHTAEEGLASDSLGFDFNAISILPPQHVLPPSAPVAPVAIQRKCTACKGEEEEQEHADEEEVRVQPKLRVGAPDDSLEREADRTADRIAREVGAARAPRSQGSAPAIQRMAQAAGTGAGAPAGLAVQGAGLEARLQSSGGGHPLAPALRRSMEQHFAADFSAVRIHDSRQARADADGLDARAFTYGSNVYLGSGARADDVWLLAHELTHVVQQGGAVRRASAPPVEQERPMVRRALADRWYGLPPIPGLRGPGTRTHDLVLPRILSDSANSQVFTEVNIPGGNRATSLSQDFASGTVGRADLYVATTTIGLNFDENGQPVWLRSNPALRRGTGRYDHSALAAPAGTTGMGPVATRTAGGPGRVERINQGPAHVEVGDLKPRADAEMRLGGGQLRSYDTGITNTATALAAFAASQPGQVSAGTWTPQVGRISASSVTIPANLRAGAAGRPTFDVVLFEGDRVIDREPRRAQLQLEWAAAHPGILAYEFVPLNGGNAAGLSNLRGLSTTGGTAPLQGLIRRLRDAPDRRGGHARDDFNLQQWQGDWQRWRTQYGHPFERGAGAREILHLETAREIARRSGVAVPTPADAAQLLSTGRQLLHWEEWGSLHGRMRSVFGRLYVRAVDLYERVSTWVSERFGSTHPRVPSTGLASRVARLAFTVLKTFATAAAAQVAVILGNSVQEGVRGQLELLFADSGLDELTSRLDSLRTLADDVEHYVADSVDAQLQSLLGPFGGWVDQFAGIESVFSTITTVVDVVKWAVRIAGCGAPPLLGCLWSVIGVQVLEEAGAALLETCWFRRGVLVPAMNQISVVRDAPRWIAQQLHGGLVGRVPELARPWLGTVPQALPTLRPEEVDCGGDAGRPSADAATTVFLEVVREFGEEYANELLRTLQHLASSGGGTRLTEAMMREIQSLGREHQSSGGNAASLRRWRGGVLSGARSWSDAVGTFRSAIRDGTATGGSAAGSAGGVHSTMILRPPPSPRPPVRIGPLTPVGPRDERAPGTGGAGLTIEF